MVMLLGNIVIVLCFWKVMTISKSFGVMTIAILQGEGGEDEEKIVSTC